MSDAEKPELRRANDNPWYCLATLYGEQLEPRKKHSNEDLATKNRTAWNRWMAGALSEEQRADIQKMGFPEEELLPFADAEKSAFCSAFASRIGRAEELPPSPSEIVDFAHTNFDRLVIFCGFLCVGIADFRSATFSGEADFSSATFFGDVDFSSVTFLGSASFRSATFFRDADFRRGAFSSSADFYLAALSRADFAAATFSQSATFGSAIFSDVANFTSTRFSDGVGFHSTTFSDDAYFRDATFSRDADFRSAVFSRGAFFQSATFPGDADFRSAAFSGFAAFDSVAFSGFTNFGGATVTGRAGFRSAIFSHDAYFSSAAFSGEADLNSATFAGIADFNSARLSGYASFYSSTFSGDAHFRSATFFDHASFYKATFSKTANFINAEFGSRTVFTDARLETTVLDFRGAKMHEATEFDGVSWPSGPRNKETAQAQVYAYERLKQEMERLKKHDDEQFFFRKELRARRGLNPAWSGTWLLNYVYEASSDYGQSIGRPLLWLFGLFLFGTAAFATAPISNGTHMTMPQAAALSFANIFSFLPLARELMVADIVEDLSKAAQIIGVVQSLIGALLLFLVGLALRTRFRMR
jgi:hypothetical protein